MQQHIDRDMGERRAATADLRRAMEGASRILDADGLYTAIALLEREILKIKKKMPPRSIKK